MRWTLKPKPSEDKIKHLAQALNVEDFVATLLIQRGIETFEDAKNFFRPSLEHLHDPYLMKDMDKAVARIERAIENQENIMVFGDYDVDGTTAVSLVSSYLKSHYPHIATYIPDRYDEGYGISYKGIDYADDNGISLIIALDCGIKSIDHIAYAKAKNIDFIVCDHHRPGEILPDAVAVLDPKREDCSYPYDELCGCGVGFKLIQALGQNRNETIEDLVPYLDLVATAIAADIVPITGENRVLAYFGLKVINSEPRPGIKALVHQAKKKVLDITDVVFIISPRINAAGRIKHGNHAVELLTEFDLEQAQQFASEIEQYNADRKDLDKKITKEAFQQILQNNEEERFSTVVFQEDWHKGVIGIVASRLIETYYRPTLVFTKSGDKYAASARSVKGFDVYNALDACSEHLEQFGGHMYAAGMTLKAENYQLFKDAFEKCVQETIQPEMRTPEIEIDAEIDFSDITPKLIRILKQFEPFGPQNMTPVFMTKDIKDTGYAKTLGAEEEHLRLFVKQSLGTDGIAAIGFGLGKKLNIAQNQNPFQLAYTIAENEWNGNISTQLMLKDIRTDGRD
ncbi:single-stranded-DNA-specific exonuclease RecJ [Flavobacterium johnsoniae]|uniref:Single-stranded-DNA-specific exonuclease RecJ n=1 Tax=Flavobacterium johnsoniae (strain ATCC 17061 / DSM 2064 / JCM 8514 / BCRC 14874 / CCUG 350202 / NBRC 14942 / NCIMB 11054 / UW101) TaxID=376686 RepID=A5FMF3_FLAJ1|nr:single-stranded-DNA-specific exonuclease RecJ [Flavobacterium johnsoniae]ABQ03625.1 single-stranded-DNA-specific exonuclease RecJ [Flavobacterium johnsoniae UW101]OXE96044.1 single-stranded-DNA-specific exonuclease RecJ [Flavobacterium johnsoniae UW101]WQG79512.1 single-stranded-DNA-specific exonuclease RecJ [Flavobacterium johnsoniae UW101]SHL97387.1 exonuclease RecJ [Flavobacterium johnsoniae]